MKLFAEENSEFVDSKLLEAGLMPKENYSLAHQSLVIPCHDVVIEHQGGALLVVRNNPPVKGIIWPIGGRIVRGISIEDSLRKKVKEECGLDISGIRELGNTRTFFSTDPFGHGKGTDTVNFMFYARGKGDLKLDALHTQPTIVMPLEYPMLRPTLHPYVQEIMDKAMEIIGMKSGEQD